MIAHFLSFLLPVSKDQGRKQGFFQDSAHSMDPPLQVRYAGGYLPGKIYDLNESKYRNSVQLKMLIQALNGKGIKVVADIVINHRSAATQDSRGVWTVFEGGTDDERLDWGALFIDKGDKYSKGRGILILGRIMMPLQTVELA